MKPILTGGLLAAVAVFVWGFLYWSLSGISTRVMHPVPDELSLAQKLAEVLPQSGAYLMPFPANTSTEEFVKRMASGPLVQILYSREGGDPLQASVFAFGFLHMLASALVMAVALRLAAPPTYGARLQLVVVAGLAGSVFGNLGRPIWWHQPWDFHLMNFAYEITSWTVAGLVLARFVRR